MSDLDKLRQQIDTIDSELLQVLAKRMEVVDRLGAYKKANGLELRDNGRFRELLADRLDQAVKLGLSEAFITELYGLVHKASLEREAGA